MPFPFLPWGALLASAVLGGALIVFGLVLRAVDHAVTASRRSMLPGLVSGFRTWASGRESDGGVESSSPEPPLPAAGTAADVEIIDLVDGRIPGEHDRA
jgi:hypothetical protein